MKKDQLIPSGASKKLTIADLKKVIGGSATPSALKGEDSNNAKMEISAVEAEEV